jgi:hypothetical protein
MCKDVGAIPSKPSDKNMAAFFVGPTETSSVTAILEQPEEDTIKCIFEYSTFPAEKKTEQVDKRTPQQILNKYITEAPCLRLTKEHGYEVCIGQTIKQSVGGFQQSNALIMSLGTFAKWENTEQRYTSGDTTGCPGSKARSAVVAFVCASELRFLDVTEPTVCSYRLTIGVPEVCGNPLFSAPPINSETWFMEISRLQEADGLVTCTVYAAGFGQPSPVDSNLITDFSLRVEQGDYILPIIDFEARYGDRHVYIASDFTIGDDSLRPKSALQQLPNLIVLTASQMGH